MGHCLTNTNTHTHKRLIQNRQQYQWHGTIFLSAKLICYSLLSPFYITSSCFPNPFCQRHAQKSPTMPSKPTFFIVRPGPEIITATGEIIVDPGTAVPLVPLDLLPEWVEIVGVPRQLTIEQAHQMRNLGYFHAEEDTYQLRFRMSEHDDDNKSLDESSSTKGSQSSPSSSSSSSSISSDKPSSPTPAAAAAAANSDKKSARGLASSMHNTQSDKLPSSSAASQPIACRFWCHTGRCKFGNNCRFKHVMPNTTAGLAEIGLEGVPTWYRAEMKLMAMRNGRQLPSDDCRQPSTKKKRQHVSKKTRLEQLQLAQKMALAPEMSTLRIQDSRREQQDVADDEKCSVQNARTEPDLEKELLIDL